MATTHTPPRFVGARLRRTEDPRFLTGRGTYLDDLQQTGLLEAAFLRSPHAHARISRIDVSAARKAPGVFLVLTGEQLKREFPTLAANLGEGSRAMEVGPLAVDKVRFVGDPVACVVATDRYRAEDACELIDVEYDVLPVIASPQAGIASDAAVIDEAVETNAVSRRTKTFGDVAGAFATADEIVRETFSSNRQTVLPMETRSCLASYNPAGGQLTCWVGTQAPHLERGWLAKGLGLEENKIRVIVPDMGGGFGQKFGLYRDEWAIAIASMKLGRPVKWIEDRRENIVASCHAREDICEVEAAVKRDGTILGLRLHMLSDVGAYPLYPGAPSDIPMMSAYTSPGPYKIPAFEYEVTCVVTNKCPQASYRAPWAFSTWIHEGIVERVARKLRLDSVDVRRRNWLRKEDQPYTMVNETGWVIDAVSVPECTERALALLDVQKFRQEQAKLRQQGKYRGFGVCAYVEPTTFGGYDVATVRVDPTGTVTALIGISGHGQGYETTMAQVVADELGVDIGQVRIVQNDTGIVTFGNGTGGSRGGVVGAGSCALATREVKAKALAIAAHSLEANVDDLEIIGGVISVKGVPSRSTTLAVVANTAYNDIGNLPPGVEPLLEATGTYRAPTPFSNSTHLCVVDVDPDTGVVTIPRYIVVNDCGAMINPMIVEGQIRGGTAQGIAGALYEEILYDESGQLLNSTLMDYLVPTPAEIPTIEIDHIVTPSPDSLGGVKGIGEGGTLGAPPAVANALFDALAPFNANPTQMPFTPERVLAMIQGG
jgi:aerobic carbon-monoxide dehydrogenase large subunit